MRADLSFEAKRLGIHLLDNASVNIGGVKFLGSTLWTDFELYANCPDNNAAFTYHKALSVMPDFRIIEQPDGRVFTPEESRQLHNQAIKWLEKALASPYAGPKVVISHHGT